jgi:hypothetical protein
MPRGSSRFCVFLLGIGLCLAGIIAASSHCPDFLYQNGNALFGGGSLPGENTQTLLFFLCVLGVAAPMLYLAIFGPPVRSRSRKKCFDPAPGLIDPQAARLQPARAARPAQRPAFERSAPRKRTPAIPRTPRLAPQFQFGTRAYNGALRGLSSGLAHAGAMIAAAPDSVKTEIAPLLETSAAQAKAVGSRIESGRSALRSRLALNGDRLLSQLDG